MANIVFNIAKGRVIELYRKVKVADPATTSLLLVPIQVTGLEADSILVDKLTLASVLSGTTLEQTTMGRKVLVAADLAALSPPDLVNDKYDAIIPTVTWTAPFGPAIAKILVAYRNTSTDADSSVIPLTLFDFPATLNGKLDIQVLSGVFFTAT